jgi:hypothetical protein
VSWTPAQSDVDAVRRTLVFLEDRRVLYAPDEVEVPWHCVEPVLRIRAFLTDQLGLGGVPDDVAGSLAMRAAARKFLDATDVEQLDREAGWRSGQILGSAGWRLNQALGEMRDVFGIHVACLAVAYRARRRRAARCVDSSGGATRPRHGCSSRVATRSERRVHRSLGPSGLSRIDRPETAGP